jgi:hypothetical protein
MPQTAARNQQSGGTIMLDFPPRGLNLLERQSLLKQRQTQPVAQFKAMEGNGSGLA